MNKGQRNRYTIRRQNNKQIHELNRKKRRDIEKKKKYAYDVRGIVRPDTKQKAARNRELRKTSLFRRLVNDDKNL